MFELQKSQVFLEDALKKLLRNFKIIQEKFERNYLETLEQWLGNTPKF